MKPDPGPWKPEDFAGLKVTVMGLGLHGGGLASAAFLASHGAELCITDLRNQEVLEPSIRALDEAVSPGRLRYVIGRHEMEDFRKADLVIKNPAVKRDNPFLLAAPRLASDISLFLDLYPGPILAVTGSKGKSSTASALAHALRSLEPGSQLGGNITRSPLSFIETIKTPQSTPVVLELSSFQLGDLSLCASKLDAELAIITNIHRDHQDYYADMEGYLRDKEAVFQHQSATGFSIFNADQEDYARRFLNRRGNAARTILASSLRQGSDLPASTPLFQSHQGPRLQSTNQGGEVLLPGRDPERILGQVLLVPGAHQKTNLLMAAGGLVALGHDPVKVMEAISTYPGIPHRMEFCAEINGVRIYNDSAATIPEASLAAVRSFNVPVHMIAGGTDKKLDFSPFAIIGREAASLSLLEGSALKGIMDQLGSGKKLVESFPDLPSCLDAALKRCKPGEVLVLSPGCASFGMFLNEFDRGNKFRDLVQARAGK